MHKTFVGTVISTKMTDTIVVEVSYKKPHPMYRKLLKRSKKYNVAPNSHSVSEGDIVTIEETRPVAKEKYFTLVTIVKSSVGDKERKETKNGSAQK